MTAAPEAPAVVMPAWLPGHCVSCAEDRPATLPLGGVSLCATCLLLAAQRQLNCEAVTAGSASQVPAPAVPGRLLDVPHALVGCEGCVPVPTRLVAHVAGMWLCPGCVAAVMERQLR